MVMQWTYHLYIMIIVILIYFEKSYTAFNIEFRRKILEGGIIGFIVICFIELFVYIIKLLF